MANVLIEEQTMSDIADAIREKNGTSNTYLPADMPQAILDILNWINSLTNFQFVSVKTIQNFEYDFKNNTQIFGLSNMFQNSSVEYIKIKNLKAIGQWYYFCSNCGYLKKIDFENCVLRPSGWNTTFSSCKNLEEINGEFDLSLINDNNKAFYNCASLRNIRFLNESIFKSISFAQSPLLDDESRQSIFDGLADLTGQDSQVLTLHKDLEEKISDEQKAYVVSKNWQLAFA